MGDDPPVVLNTPGGSRETVTVVTWMVEYRLGEKWVPLPVPMPDGPDDVHGAREAYRAAAKELHFHRPAPLRLVRRVAVITDEVIEQEEP